MREATHALKPAAVCDLVLKVFSETLETFLGNSTIRRWARNFQEAEKVDGGALDRALV